MPRRLRQPHAALADLCDGFFDDLAFIDTSACIDATELPPAAARLLVHREHMTSVLRDHCGAPLELSVLQHRTDADEYARKILLTVAGSKRVAELGIVRLSMGYLPAAVRSEVLAGATPLGDILTRHNILRRISPRWYFRFAADSPIGVLFGKSENPAYGRVGTIFCDEEPAIDVLEVVSV